MSYILIKIAVGTEEEANKIATELVRLRIVASAQIKEIKSIYTWKNEVETADEYEITCYTVSDNFQKVTESVYKNSKYEVTQVIGLCITKIEDDLKNWITENTK